MTRNVSAREGRSPIAPSPAAAPDATRASGLSNRLAGLVKSGTPTAPRSLPQRLLDRARAALDKIASVLPGAARHRGASAAGPSGAPQPQPADGQTLQDATIQGFTDEELHMRVANLNKASATIRGLKEHAAGSQATGYSAAELRLHNTAARLRAETVARANKAIDGKLDGALAHAARLAGIPGAGRELDVRLRQAFSVADQTLRVLEEERGISLGNDPTTTPGARRLGAASLFVAAALGRLDTGDRRLLLGAMDTDHLRRLAQADPTGLAAGAFAGAAITAAKDELARRAAGLAKAAE